MTPDQIRKRTKTVTRRMGWLNLKPGQQIRAVKKRMGLKPGEKIEQLAVLTVVNVRRERLAQMTDDSAYGEQECALEGFSDYSPIEFVEMFCRAHKGTDFTTEVTRIEFAYSAATTVRMAAG